MHLCIVIILCSGGTAKPFQQIGRVLSNGTQILPLKKSTFKPIVITVHSQNTKDRRVASINGAFGPVNMINRNAIYYKLNKNMAPKSKGGRGQLRFTKPTTAPQSMPCTIIASPKADKEILVVTGQSANSLFISRSWGNQWKVQKYSKTSSRLSFYAIFSISRNEYQHQISMRELSRRVFSYLNVFSASIYFLLIQYKSTVDVDINRHESRLACD